MKIDFKEMQNLSYQITASVSWLVANQHNALAWEGGNRTGTMLREIDNLENYLQNLKNTALENARALSERYEENVTIAEVVFRKNREL